MKKESLKFDASIVAELICCLLGGCALCSAILPAMGQEVGMLDCLLFVAVDLSLIFLLSRRWWITPLLLGLLALFGFWFVYLFRLRTAIIEYVQGFIEWYNAAYPYTLPYSENGSQFIVHLLFSFPVTLLLYLYFRRFPFLPIWIALSGALLLWMYYAAPEHMLAVAALLLIVLFVLLTRTNARSINRKLGKDEKIPSSAMQLTALVLAPLVVLLAIAFGPKVDGAWQSVRLVNFVEDVQDVFSFYGDGSYGAGSFDLSYSGLAPNGWVLGGDIQPNNKAVLRAKTSTPILLAGAVYDTYDGRGWYDSTAVGRFRFTSPLWRGKRREVFTIDKPSSKRAAALYEKLSKNVALEISMAVKFRSFFAGGKMERLTLPYGDDASVYFNTQGELFTLEFPDVFPSYEIKARVFDREREDFDENMRLLLRYTAAEKDKEYEEIAQRCTFVPDTVEPFVRELAQEITRYCTDDYDKALAIEKWIGENCTYTQTPGDAPEGRDFVSAFLESREGYCTYYASAMTVLARLAGLPARYVTGYGLKQANQQPGTTAYIATNATAHAWTQIYFYGVGWVDFDPTNWDFYELAELDTYVYKDPKPVETPAPPVIPTPEPPEPEEPESSAAPGSVTAKKTDRTGRIVLIVLCCDLAAFLLFLLLRFVLLFFRVESFYYHLSRRYKDNASRADVCYRQILKQLGFLGLEMQPSDTIVSFCERADAALESERGRDRLAEVCEPVVLSRFAMRQPTNGEVRRLCDFYIFMERTLRKKLGLRRYILRRMLLGR